MTHRYDPQDRGRSLHDRKLEQLERDSSAWENLQVRPEDPAPAGGEWTGYSWQQRFESDRGYGLQGRSCGQGQPGGESEFPPAWGRELERGRHAGEFEAPWSRRYEHQPDPGYGLPRSSRPNEGGYPDEAWRQFPISASTGTHDPFNWASRWARAPRNYHRTDERICEEICERIVRYSQVDASDVQINVIGGEVKLQGTVSDRRSKNVIEEIADSVWGVRDIDNDIRVKRFDERVDADASRSSGPSPAMPAPSTAPAGPQRSSAGRSSLGTGTSP